MTREEASEIINNYFFHTVLRCNGRVVKQHVLVEAMSKAIEALRETPRIKAKWVEYGVFSFECSNCNCRAMRTCNYCSNCGAKMEGIEQ